VKRTESITKDSSSATRVFFRERGHAGRIQDHLGRVGWGAHLHKCRLRSPRDLGHSIKVPDLATRERDPRAGGYGSPHQDDGMNPGWGLSEYEIKRLGDRE
jgi:hypothetical protein